MKRERIYIQYNDLVFDGYDMLGEYDSSNTSFKVTTHDRSFWHGSYAPFKSEYSYVEETNVSITLWLYEKKLPCEYRPFYRSFVIEQLSKHGKLWAIQDNTLVWAYATVTNYSEMSDHYDGRVGIDIDFLLYEGLWHKADKQKTFLHPYDVCTFMECYNYREYQPCDLRPPFDCCTECPPDEPDAAIDGKAIVYEAILGKGHGKPKKGKYDIGTRDCCLCDCDDLTEDMALCYHLNDLQGFYATCTNFGFRIIYDCDAAERFFGRIGQSICVTNCHNGVLAGKIYSETDIPTDNVTITLVGKMYNPYVEINGNGNYIKGKYDGTIVITNTGDVFYENCGCDDPLDASVWKVPEGMSFGWTIKPRNNRVIVNLGDCCGKACAYFDIDNLTI